MNDKKMIIRNCPAILKMTKVCDGRWYVTKEDDGTIWSEPKWFRK